LKQLRAAREERQLSQRELGRRLQKPHTYIGKCESGERQLNIAELKLWCEALEISLPHFVLKLDEAWRLTKGDLPAD